MKLEEYIKRNRKDFEDELPPDLWVKVQTQLPKKKPMWPVYTKLAASLFIFLGIGFLWGRQTTPSDMKELNNYDATLVTYTNKVNQKKEKLGQLVSNQPELEVTFSKDLSDLQEEFDYLKSQLKNNPNRELVIAAMIQNLEWQIELLNQQTKIAEKGTVKLL